MSVAARAAASFFQWRRARSAVLAVSSLAIFLDVFLWSCIIPLLPRIVEERAHIRERESQAWAQSVLFCSCAAGLLVATPVVGVLTDVMRQRRGPMVVGLAALSAATVLFALARGLPLLVVARILQGVAAAVTFVVGFAMIGDAYPPSELGGATGIALAAQTLGDTGGLIVGGYLGQRYGLSTPFYLCAFLALFDLAGRVYVLPQPPVRVESPTVDNANHPNAEGEAGKEKAGYEASDSAAAQKDQTAASPRAASPEQPCLAWQECAGMARLVAMRDVAVNLLVIVLFAMLVTGIEAVLPAWLQRSLGLDETQTGAVMLAFILPQVVLSPIIGRLSDRVSRRLLIAFGLAVFGASYPAIELASRARLRLIVHVPPAVRAQLGLPALLVLAAALTGSCCALVRVPATPRLAALVDAAGLGGRAYGRLFALVNVAFSLGMLLGPLALSALYVRLGLFGALSAVGLACVASSPLYLLLTSPECRPAQSGV